MAPLKPTATNWPCECRTNLLWAGANADGDAGVNAIEYALGTNPRTVTTNGWPAASLVSTDGHTHGALTYTRIKAATDVVYEVVASSSLTSSSWQALTTVHDVTDFGATEQVTVRDVLPVHAGEQRFYRLLVRLR